MIQLVLKMYHVPEDIQVMLDDYFNRFRMRLSTNRPVHHRQDQLGNWNSHGLCHIPYPVRHGLQNKEAQAQQVNVVIATCPPLKAFMNDTTIISSNEEKVR